MKRQHICMGYCIENGIIKVHEEESEIIKKIFNLALEGKSAHAVAKYFNDTKVTPIIQAKQWYHGNILSIVRNKTYMGTEVYPRIIDNNTFYKVNEQHPFVSKKERNGNHLLFGIVKCKVCGSSYHRYEVNHNIYWGCPKSMNHEKSKCQKLIISEKELIFQTLEQINSLIIDSQKIEVHPQSIQFHKEGEYARTDKDLKKSLQKKESIEKILQIAQKKSQILYEGLDEITYQYRYERIVKNLKNKPLFKHLDTKLVKECIKGIKLDSNEQTMTIELINDQDLTTNYQAMRFQES